MGRRTELPRHRVKWMIVLLQPLALRLLASNRVLPQSSRHTHHHTLARLGSISLSMFTAIVYYVTTIIFRVPLCR